jgi:mutator protein MutT
MTVRTLGTRAGIIIADTDKILLLNRNHKGRQFYCIPGGHVEEGETPEECAVREMKEESSLNVELGDLFIELENQGRKEYYFWATSWSGTPHLGGEEAERNCPEDRFTFEWIPYQQLASLVLYPRLVHEKLIEHFQKAFE